MASINDELNLVVPVRVGEGGVRLYAYHSPISREVFEANYRLLGAAKAALASKGVYFMMDVGPRIAALTLKDEGRKEAEEQGENGDGGASALLEEIKRLTMILVPGASGWELMPVDSALSQGAIDREEWSEAEAAIVFFTFHCALSRKAERGKVAKATASVLKGWNTSSTATAYAASLPTSTTNEASVGKAGSSVPS